MRHTISMTAALALALPGCFDAHGITVDHDAGPGDDAATIVRTCEAALDAPDGALCEFTGTCGGVVTDCGPPAGTQCVDGRVRHLRPICTRALPRNCDEYLAWSWPGDICFESEFVGCALREEDGCVRTISCSEGTIHDATSCDEPVGTCEGYAPPPPELPTCTESAECTEGPCAPPGSTPACGACRIPERACESDVACGPGQVCVETLHPCSCAGPDSACRADCNLVDDACPPGTQCAGDGHCRPLDCTAGEWTCGPNLRCGAGFDGALDEHGCARLGCEDALDCDCGACIDGLCHDGPGTCSPPAP